MPFSWASSTARWVTLSMSISLSTSSWVNRSRAMGTRTFRCRGFWGMIWPSISWMFMPISSNP